MIDIALVKNKEAEKRLGGSFRHKVLKEASKLYHYDTIRSVLAKAQPISEEPTAKTSHGVVGLAQAAIALCPKEIGVLLCEQVAVALGVGGVEKRAQVFGKRDALKVLEALAYR